ncbi:MAG: rhomboid family intramembrane serine protease [Bdellovibrionota bacterium]
MNGITVIIKNWMTRKPKWYAQLVTVIMTSILLLASSVYLKELYGANDWMPASRELVFGHHQYWRAWTSLFAHADIEHLLSNAFLFIPLAYLLTGYFGYWVFPAAGIFLGGIINLFVLQRMPWEIHLIGISGVVYWMGAVWLTLFLLVDRRESIKRRFAKVLFITVVLFIPQTYKPQVSYFSHFIGYFFGIASALVIYYVNRQKFIDAEVTRFIPDEDEIEKDAIVGFVPESTIQQWRDVN